MFLTNVGLPKNAPFLLNFYTDERLLQSKQFLGGDYLVIGDDEGTTICIEETSGEVYSVDFNGDLPLRFINSDIRALINCLQAYRSRESDLREASDEEAVAIVEALRTEFNRIDPRALEDPENWWSVILEQVELGLL